MRRGVCRAAVSSGRLRGGGSFVRMAHPNRGVFLRRSLLRRSDDARPPSARDAEEDDMNDEAAEAPEPSLRHTTQHVCASRVATAGHGEYGGVAGRWCGGGVPPARAAALPSFRSDDSSRRSGRRRLAPAAWQQTKHGRTCATHTQPPPNPSTTTRSRRRTAMVCVTTTPVVTTTTTAAASSSSSDSRGAFAAAVVVVVVALLHVARRRRLSRARARRGQTTDARDTAGEQLASALEV